MRGMRIMRLSTSTNIMDRVNKVQGIISPEDCLIKCAKAGYKVMDMNFHDMSNKGMPVAQDNWEEWVDKMGELGAKLGLEFSQSHSHFYNVCLDNLEDREWREELVRRSIIGSGKLGVKWMVLHAGTDNTMGYSAETSKRRNLEYFKPHIEFAKKHNVGIAIENLFDPNALMRKYTATTEELIDLVDTLNDPMVGICWDFGHANLVGIDQNISLRKIGKRLKATHISDNNGVKDEHLLPFYGNIEWDPIMQTLVDIDYEYDFTFEITPFVDKIPAYMRDILLQHTVEVGNHLLSLAK